MGLHRWIEFVKIKKNTVLLGSLLNPATTFKQVFNVKVFFTIHFLPTFSFLLQVCVNCPYISAQRGSGTITESSCTRKYVLSGLWQTTMGRQLLELSTCWNYFLSLRQDVIKLKNIGFGQNNRGWTHVWKLFSRGLTRNQKKVEEEEEEEEEDTVERAWLKGPGNSEAAVFSDIHEGCDLRATFFVNA